MSSCDSDDDFVEYGTPLEPLEEDEIPRKKPCLLEDQVVKDKQGRRRFHGAFTGGFSAGFFNTVGSLEGWKPSTFKSSKSEKQKVLFQRPEDFMDEEDIGEFGIAPHILKAKDSYVTEEKRKLPSFAEGPIPGASVLKDLLKPVRETVGMKLLRKMGWKPGQGVGPRTSKSEKKKTSKMRQKMYGCQLPPGAVEEQEGSDSESEWDDIAFAPDDYEVFLCNPKDNFFGIGYKGLDKRPILSSSNQKQYQLGEINMKIRGQGFGVGALEEEDEDIYCRDDMSRYDFSLGNEVVSEKSIPKTYSTEEEILEGFVAEIKKHIKKQYALPVLPKNYRPRARRTRVSRFDDPPSQPVKKINVQENSKHRAELLEDISEKNLRQQQLMKSTEELIVNVKISTGSFKPFALNPDKQSRYEKYLKLIEIGKKDLLTDLQPITMTEWDKNREKMEFDQASKLFKPLAGAMGDRFLSASQPDDLSDPLAVVEKFRYGNEDQINAAKMNMYGPLTRRTEDWSPCHLLCKRFNVPVPGESTQKPTMKKQDRSSFFNFVSTERFAQQKTVEIVNETVTDPPHALPSPAKTEKMDEKREETTETLEKEVEEVVEVPKNKIDVFKEIFLGSDTEDEDESSLKKDSKEEQEEKIEGSELLFEEKILNDKRNTSPPKGIFENVDLQALSTLKPFSMEQNSREDLNKVQTVIEKVESDFVPLDLIYGPKIPDKVVHGSSQINIEYKGDDSCWVEKTPCYKKHKKKDKKSKKSSHKSKHKHKKSKKSH